MSFLKKIFKRKEIEIDQEQAQQDYEDLELLIEQLEERADILSPQEREEYVTECLQHMQEAATKVEELTLIYTDVTLHLTDIEELDRLPEVEKHSLRESAKKILALSEEQNRPVAKERRVVLTKKQFYAMEKLQDEMPTPYNKLKECEEYQELIKQDLKRLGVEKVAYTYRKEELDAMLYNTRGMSITCLIAFVVCAFFLMLLQIGLDIDVTIGYVIAIMAVSIAVTILCVKHIEYKKEKRMVSASYAKIVSLQNKVKIRYVNNTNLLEFLRVRYQCESSKIMDALWKRYQAELIERERFERTKADLSFENREFAKKIDVYPIQDKEIWLSQIPALADPREMVEIRHYYNTQRQNLREQIQFNQEIAEKMHEEIKNVAFKYPDSAKQVLEIIMNYERERKKL
ncbi:MAG: hypothetical protein R3Y54_03470 [Eubacteriales bacterium]